LFFLSQEKNNEKIAVLILVNCQLMAGHMKRQPEFTENAELRVHFDRPFCEASVSSRLRRLEEYRGINFAFGD
jgi:hypothetical protein